MPHGLPPFVLAVFAALQEPDSVPTAPDTAFELRPLVVTATRVAESPRLAQPAAISVIPVAAARRPASLVAPDLLREAGGIHVQQTSAGQGAVILRGLVGNQVLLLVDGIPLNNGTFRDGPGQYLATVDPESVERVEVIRGPGSVLYGSDAQGGVVNLITRPHPEAPEASVRGSVGASGANRGYRARLSAGQWGGRWSLAVGSSLARADDVRAGAGLGAQTPTAFESSGFDVRAAVRAGKRHEVVAGVQRFAMADVPRYDRYVAFRAPAPGPDVEHVFDPQIRELGYVRFVRTGSRALARLEATASLAVQREGRVVRRRLSTGEADSVREHVRDDVLTPGLAIVGRSELASGRGALSLLWGAEAYGDRLKSRGHSVLLTTGARTPLTRTTGSGAIPSGRFPDGSTAERLGVFVSAETQVGGRLRLSVGGRWSRFRAEAEVGQEFGGRVSSSSVDLTGQLGAVLEVAAGWRVAARLAEGFRAPNLYDLTNVGPVPGGVQLPNPDARPERSLSGELAVRHWSADGGLELTLYRATIRDFIDRVPGVFNGDPLYNGQPVFQGMNVGRARIAGFEAEAAKRAGPLEARLTAVYTRGDQRVAGSVEEPMAKIPPLSGTVALRWSRRGHWVEYGIRWAGSQRRLGSRDLQDPRIAPDGTPGYVAHGVRAGGTLGPALSVSGGLENVTDRLYRDHGSGVDNPGRHAWVGLAWTVGDGRRR